MKKKHRSYSPRDKVTILRRYLVDREPLSNLCDEYGIHPATLYRWQKEFFERGEAAFEHRSNTYTKKLEKKVSRLEEKIGYKDEVIGR